MGGRGRKLSISSYASRKDDFTIFPVKARAEYMFKDETVATHYTRGMALQFETSGSVICKNILMLVCEL